jgi:propionyl-CoA synthetase
VPCAWLESNSISYTLYTSGTTGKPKGVQRDVGGYAVALATSMDWIFGGKPGETFFSTSDIGWVVGHSYIVYGPLIAGMATLMYEGTPVAARSAARSQASVPSGDRPPQAGEGQTDTPDAAVLWRLVEQYRVTVMFSAPTAVRVLKKHDAALLKRHDLSSLRALFLAGEPLDEPTARWISDGLGVPIIDNYWQTETGWPLLTVAHHIPGVQAVPTRLGSPGVPMYGYDVRLLDEQTGEELTAPNQKGVLAIAHPLPPGALQTVWGDDARFVNTYWKSVPGREGGREVYSTFDWGLRDADGYTFILGRTDDVINVAGHRLGTREIEECISAHAAVAEVAVVGVADALKGQVALAFAVLRDPGLASPALEAEVLKHVDAQLGAVARPSRVLFVGVLPKTRSGKLLRRALQAVAEGRDPGDLTTLDDPGALAQVKSLLGMSNG